MKGERVYIVADGLVVYSGRDAAKVLRLRDRHWRDALILDHAPDPGKVRIITKKAERDFLVGQGYGFRTVRWRAWREPRPKVRGYGKTEQEAIEDLVKNVQPLVEVVE